MIVLTFKITNVRLALAGATSLYPELSGVFHVYTSSDLGPMKDTRSGTGPDLEQGIVTTADDASKKYTLHLPEATKIKGSSSLVVSLYAVSCEEMRSYLVPCGSGIVNMGELISAGNKQTQFNITLSEPHSESPIQKGTLTLCVLSVESDAEKAKETDNLTRDDEYYSSMVMNYIGRSLNIFLEKSEAKSRGFGNPKWLGGTQKYSPTHHKIKRIHCPYYQTDFVGKELPGFAYCWQRPRTRPDEAYFVRLIRAALQVYEMDEAEFENSIDQQFEEEGDKVVTGFKLALDVIAGACSLYSQGQLYVPDHVNLYSSKGRSFDPEEDVLIVENMNNLRVTRGNDCEDMGADNLITAMTLRDHKGWTHPLTQRCQQVLLQFFPLLPHAAVSTASASQTLFGSLRDPDFIAHIFCLLLPIERVKIMLSRTNTPSSLLGLTKEMPKWNANLDVLVCEGTGRVSPILKPEWEWKTEDKRFYVETARVQAQFEITNPRFSRCNILQVSYVSHPKNSSEFNSFYQYVVAAFIPQYSGSSVGDISFVYPKSKTYGILIHDLVYDVNEPGLAVNETISDEERDYITQTMELAHPVPTLHPRSSKLESEDIMYLTKTLGLKQWTPKSKCKHFGYFFTMDEIRRDPSIVKYTGPFDATYKYIGLDDFTAYIEFCVCPK